MFKQLLWPWHDCICNQRLPIRWLWLCAVAGPLDYTWCNTQMHWHSVDTRLTLCWISVDSLLMLCWRSFNALLTLISRCKGVDRHDITYKGCQFLDYGLMRYHTPSIIEDATPQIVDALLMLIFRLGMGPCRVLFCPSTLPICWLRIPVSKWHPNGLTY